MKAIHIRDECWSASSGAHQRMRRELGIYHNTRYPETERIIKDLIPTTNKSLNPQVQKGILRLISPMAEQATRIDIQPDRSDFTEEEIEFTQDIDNWNVMMEEARGEPELIETFILHNLAMGNAVAKTYFDTKTHVVRSDPVNPLSIAVDGGASRIDLSDAQAVCQQYWFDQHHLKKYYDWTPPEGYVPKEDDKMRWNQPTYRLDEIWIRRELAEECSDIDQDKLEQSKKVMFRIVLINDEVVSVTGTPFYWPDFPYSFWRNFSSVNDHRKGTDFFGFGYGTLLNPQQKFLDEMISNLVLTARNMPTGRYITTEGTLDAEQLYNENGTIVELPDGKVIGEDIQELPPHQVSPIFFESINYFTQIMQEQMPSLQQVFTGESPGNDSSGRAINSLQWAAFNQLSANLRAMNEFRKHRTRQTVTLIQQKATKPLSPHIWRGGLDLPSYFPEDARSIGFQLVANDSAAMPHSPIAKLQVAQQFGAMGYVMTLEELLKFTGFDRGYGLQAEMFQQVPVMGPDGMPMMANEAMLSGAEAPLP